MTQLRCSALRRVPLALVLLAVMLGLFTALANPASAQTASTLYAFGGFPDGNHPSGGLISDAKGNLYGTTTFGGDLTQGSVFELAPPVTVGGAWTETILYSFPAGTGGGYPVDSLVIDKFGALYGVTIFGGDPICNCGVVFEVQPPAVSGAGWSEQVIYAFPAYGNYPAASLTLGTDGSLYGVTAEGGTFFGGTAFKLTPAAGGGFAETDLYYFGATAGDSYKPSGPLLLDSSGALYGVSSSGGSAPGPSGNGTVFKLTPPTLGSGTWTNTILRTFGSGKSGCFAEGSLVLDKNGYLYGITGYCGVNRNGVFYRLAPPKVAGGAWVASDLYSFPGRYPVALSSGLVLDRKSGTFFATVGNDRSAVKLTPPAIAGSAWSKTVLANLGPTIYGSDGYGGPFIEDANGLLYGTTNGGIGGNGTVFTLTH